ncbi:MAG: hypothetical protein AcusKO_44380 [Acuticoccus sp.]
MAGGGRNLFPNAGLTSWPNGLVVSPRERFDEVTEGWFFDKRRGSSPQITCAADKPADIALSSGEYAMKVTVTAGGDEGYMRLVVPLSITPDAVHNYRLSLGLRSAAGGAGGLHVVEIFLGTHVNGSVQKVSTIRRNLKQRGTIRLAQLPLVRGEKKTEVEADAKLCIAIDIRGEGDLTIFSPALTAAGVRDLGTDTTRHGDFEDPNIRDQTRTLKLSRLWEPVPSVAGPLGSTPIPLPTRRKTRPQAAVPFIQIVVPVFNAAIDTEALLDSILRCTTTPFEVLIVDDGSSQFSAARVAAWQQFDPRIHYIGNAENVGYTRNINRGLQLTVADYVVLINSDTIVTPRWLEKMFQVMTLDKAIAAVGPLSNAASWQSVPRTKAPDGDWIINRFDRSCSADDIALILEELHDGASPEFPLLNGFCTLFRKRALEDAGYFNDAAFPRGYGEENDLCLRLGQAGWTLRLATDTFVHHAKSKSFGDANRRKLSSAANRILRDLHPEVDFPAIEERMRSEASMVRLRRELANRVKVESAFRTETP